LHERTISLSADGTRLEGEDVFRPADGGEQVQTSRDKYAIRFHLHPTVKVTRLSDGHAAMLMAPDQDVWTFSVREGRVELEDSVYLAGAEGPRRTMQLVVYGHAQHAPRVVWSLQAGAAIMARTPARNVRAEEPKLES
jgi:uncharacterized heparinase superfamily protein